VPEENFRPDTGSIAVYRPPMGPGIRLDSGVEQNSEVGFHYDPMLAKLIVWAPNRDASIDRMRRALSDFVLLGVRNNIEFLHRVVSHADFRAGTIDTHFLEHHAELRKPTTTDIPVEALLAASLSSSESRENRATNGTGRAFDDVWQSGAWRNA
jgi:acetyl/propionyl-CoA carboxylase alpha subunit